MVQMLIQLLCQLDTTTIMHALFQPFHHQPLQLFMGDQSHILIEFTTINSSHLVTTTINQHTEYGTPSIGKIKNELLGT